MKKKPLKPSRLKNYEKTYQIPVLVIKTRLSDCSASQGDRCDRFSDTRQVCWDSRADRECLREIETQIKHEELIKWLIWIICAIELGFIIGNLIK